MLLKQESEISRILLIVGCVLFLVACAERAPVRLQNARTNSGQPGLLWTYSYHTYVFPERVNHASVIGVDGESIDHHFSRPLELSPGEHQVEIRYEKDSLLCGYFGCLRFQQMDTTLALSVEEGHSYFPFARTHCDTQWIWIVDTGNPASEDLAHWHAKGIYQFSRAIGTQQNPTPRVVAGSAPGKSCIQGRP